MQLPAGHCVHEDTEMWVLQHLGLVVEHLLHCLSTFLEGSMNAKVS